jgi:hypothetical protein
MAVIWIGTGRFAPAYDADAQAYITAVESADGQALETGVRDAINAFVVGCKADGIWTAIKASCILAGARTLAGALVPLVGAAPTRFGTAGGWNYNRETGLAGNGTDNYLNTNRANNADPQNSKHIACYAPVAPLASAVVRNPGPACAAAGNNTGGSGMPMDTQVNNNQIFRVNGATSVIAAGAQLSAGFRGANRASSSTITGRIGGNDYSGSSTSEAPQNINLTVFARNIAPNGIDNFINFPLSFYSIGESLNLALLDARVTALINAIAAAIP